MVRGKIMTDNYRLHAKLTADTIKSKYRSSASYNMKPILRDLR